VIDRLQAYTTRNYSVEKNYKLLECSEKACSIIGHAVHGRNIFLGKWGIRE